jgi:hypothetical protein
MLPPAPACFDDELLAQDLSHLQGDEARDRVGAAARVNGMRMRTGLFGQVACPIAGQAMLGASAAARTA